MKDEIKRNIAWALKHSTALIPKRQRPDPDIAYNVAAKDVLNQLELSHEIRRKPAKPGHKTGEMD